MKLEVPVALSLQKALSRCSGRAENKEPIKVCLTLGEKLRLWDVTYGRHRWPRKPYENRKVSELPLPPHLRSGLG